LTKINIIEDLNIGQRAVNYANFGILNTHMSTFRHLKSSLMMIYNLTSAETLVIQDLFGATPPILRRDGNIVINLMKVIQKAYGATRVQDIKENKILQEMGIRAKIGALNLHTNITTLQKIMYFLT
jgi:hypothetical protein